MESISGQVAHFNTPGISRYAGLRFLADGFAFFAVGVAEFVVEFEVHPHVEDDGEEGAEAQVLFGGQRRLPCFIWVLGSLVNISAMSDSHHQHKKLAISDLAKDAVVAD